MFFNQLLSPDLFTMLSVQIVDCRPVDDGQANLIIRVHLERIQKGLKRFVLKKYTIKWLLIDFFNFFLDLWLYFWSPFFGMLLNVCLQVMTGLIEHIWVVGIADTSKNESPIVIGVVKP